MYRKVLLFLCLFIIAIIPITAFADDVEAVLDVEMNYGNDRVCIQNNGLIAKQGEFLYYSANDSGDYKLIKHNESTNERQVLMDIELRYINVIDGYIYGAGYVKNELTNYQYAGIYKIKTDGSSYEVISTDIAHQIIVVNDKIFYTSYDSENSVYKDIYYINTDGSNKQLVHYGWLNKFTVYKDNVYYTIYGALYKQGIDGSNLQKVGTCHTTYNNANINIYNDKIYIRDNSKTKCYSLDGEKELKDDEFSGVYDDYLLNNGYRFYRSTHTVDGDRYSVLYKVNLETEEETYLFGGRLLNYYILDNNIYLYDVVDNLNTKIIRINTDAEQETCIYPPLSEENKKVKDILDKAYENINSTQRYNVIQNIVKYDKQYEIEQSCEYRIDKTNKMNNLNVTQTAYIDNVSKFALDIEIWADETNYHLTQSNLDEWYHYKNTDGDNWYYNIYSVYDFLLPNYHYYMLDLRDLNSNSYLIKGKIESSNIDAKLKDNLHNIGALSYYEYINSTNVEILINKKDYEISKVKINLEVGEILTNTTKTISIEYSNDFNASDSLILDNTANKSFNNSQKAETYANLAKVAIDEGKYKEAISHCNTALNIYSCSLNAFKYKGIAYFNTGEYELAQNEYDNCYNYCYWGDFNEVYVLDAECSFLLGDFDRSLEQALNVYDDNLNDDYKVRLYSILAENYFIQSEYESTLMYCEKILENNPDDEGANLYKLASLVLSRDYLGALKWVSQIENKVNDTRFLLYYKALAYMGGKDYDRCTEELNKALKDTNKESISDADINRIFMVLDLFNQQYDKAQEYLYKIIDETGETYETYVYQSAIDEGRRPQAEKVCDFIKNNYLYANEITNIDDILDNYMAKGDQLTPVDITEMLNSIKVDEDKFSFFVSGEAYDNIYDDNGNTKSVSYKQIDESTEYIKIEQFDYLSSAKFREYIYNINNPEKKKLIIDLRDNGGGLTNEATDMLDVLLPECTSAYLIDRKGTITPTQSYESNIAFNEIIVFVNSNSASASELLTLSLKKHLRNVTVIGQKTLGKGVAQSLYEDKNNKYMILLVSHYWNVIEENINVEGIIPDILIEGTEDSDYFGAIQTNE